MKKALLLLFVALGLFAACSEKEETPSEYDNWASRNATAFVDTLRIAQTAIAKAKAQYGEAWESHCAWRTFRSYTVVEGAALTWKDSIAVRIYKQGAGSGSPLYTDSVRVAYIGRLLPTSQHPQGFVFDKSGLHSDAAQAFLPQYLTTTKFLTSNLVVGYTTALQKMHIGDQWRVFMPAELGYGAQKSKTIPAQSMLIFDIQLSQYWRKGFKAD